MTREIVQAAAALRISIHDHIVVGRGGTASFKALGSYEQSGTSRCERPKCDRTDMNGILADTDTKSNCDGRGLCGAKHRKISLPLRFGGRCDLNLSSVSRRCIRFFNRHRRRSKMG